MTDYYKVDEILDRKMFGKKLKYLVKWEDWPVEQSTWEPLHHLRKVYDRVKLFNDKNKFVEKKKRTRKRLGKYKDKVKVTEQAPVDLLKKCHEFSINIKPMELLPLPRVPRVPSEQKIPAEDFPPSAKENTTPTEEKKVEQTIQEEVKISPIIPKPSYILNMTTPGNIHCDVPIRVISARVNRQAEVMCLLEWQRRYDGSEPLSSSVSSKVLRKEYPQLLIDYYESKIK